MLYIVVDMQSRWCRTEYLRTLNNTGMFKIKTYSVPSAKTMQRYIILCAIVGSYLDYPRKWKKQQVIMKD